jgi:endo-1,4-beta-xylanase
MKKFSILLCSILIIALSLTSVFTVSATSTADVKRGTPVVDAEIDDIWNYADSLALDKLIDGSKTDTTGYLKLLWDDTNLYALVVINDNTPHLDDGGEASSKDSLEVYVDIFNKKPDNFDDQDGVFYFGVFALGGFDRIYSGDAPNGGSTIKAVSVVKGTQYIYEMSLPLNDLAVAAVKMNAGMSIGFDIQVNDNAEGNSSRAAAFDWADSENKAWQDPSYFGTITLSAEEAFIEIVDEAPVGGETPAVAAETKAAVETQTPVAAPQTSDMLVFFAVAAILALIAGVAVVSKRSRNR